LAHAVTAANTTFAIQFLCGDEWQKKMERSNKSARKQRRKYVEGTKETNRKKDIQETLGGGIFFSAEFFRCLFFFLYVSFGEDGESEKAGKRERVKWRD
jgi:hypothetical protein